MANRTTIKHGELEIFKEYLIQKDFEIEPIKAKYEVLRARYKGKKSNSKYKSQKTPLILYDRERGCGYTLQRPYETIYATFDEFKQNWYKEHSIDTGSKEVEYRYRQYELEQKEYIEKWKDLG